MKFTWLLPDWVPVMRFRGFLVKPCFKRCGVNFQLASTVMIVNSAMIEVGNDVYLAHGCWVQGVGGVVIGDEVMLGPYTVLASSNHSMVDGSYRFGRHENQTIRIGRGAWTGAGTKVVAGVTIGCGVLCAAGSVVTRDVSDYAIVGGVPARVLARVDPATRERVPVE